MQWSQLCDALVIAVLKIYHILRLEHNLDCFDYKSEYRFLIPRRKSIVHDIHKVQTVGIAVCFYCTYRIYHWVYCHWTTRFTLNFSNGVTILHTGSRNTEPWVSENGHIVQALLRTLTEGEMSDTTSFFPINQQRDIWWKIEYVPSEYSTFSIDLSRSVYLFWPTTEIDNQRSLVPEKGSIFEVRIFLPFCHGHVTVRAAQNPHEERYLSII